jgi:hypothetical protein
LRNKDSLETVIDDDLGLFFAWAAKARVRPEPGKARVHGVLSPATGIAGKREVMDTKINPNERHRDVT